jgi:hypothetical protein
MGLFLTTAHNDASAAVLVRSLAPWCLPALDETG